MYRQKPAFSDTTYRPHRRKGTEGTLGKWTYADLSRLSGYSPNTVRLYAWRKKYDPHDLDSVLRFITSSRVRNGLPAIV